MSYYSRRGSYINSEVVVKKPEQLLGRLRGDVVYLIDGVIDIGSNSIIVPSEGLNIIGLTFDISILKTDEDNTTIFTSAAGGSGNLVIDSIGLSATGTNSKVFDLVDFDGTHAIEITRVNYNSCSSLGIIDSYRQLLEDGTGRFGGSPELTFDGSCGGARISTTITRNIVNISSLFKAGPSLTFSGRFITNMNCDLPATGAFIDFSPANIIGDESLNIKGAIITRNGLINTSDETTHPNISDKDNQSLWSDNTGISNTQKYIRATLTSESVTVINNIDEYVPINGVMTTNKESHFSSPSNGTFRLDSGNGSYQISGDFSMASKANDLLELRVIRSNDGGVVFDDEIFSVTRPVSSLVGGRDVSFITFNFIESVEKNDILRLEVRNKTSARNITVELSSYFTITSI